MFHRPGLPSDLPEPEALWSRAGAVAVAARGTGEGGGALVDRSLSLGWPGAGFHILRVDDERFVLLGEDPGSTPALGLRRPTDPFDGAPSWLPFDWLERHRMAEPDFVYWWEGTWVRAAYPDDWDDDGLADLLGWSATREATVAEVGRVLGVTADPGAAEALVSRAQGRDLTRESLTKAVAGVPGFDVGTSLTVANGLGLTEGAEPPELPSGHGPPPTRSAPLIGRDEWALLVGDAMRAAGEEAGFDPSGRADPPLLENGPPAAGSPVWAGLLDPRTRWAPPWPGPPGRPSVPPAALEADERALLIDRIRALLIASAGDLPWRALRLVYRSLVGYSGGSLVAVCENGERGDGRGEGRPVPLPEVLRGEMALLRSATFSPGYGAWFTARLNLTRDGGWHVAYDRVHEPEFSFPPPAFSYALDARYFPRDRVRTPLWLAEHLRAASQGAWP